MRCPLSTVLTMALAISMPVMALTSVMPQPASFPRVPASFSAIPSPSPSSPARPPQQQPQQPPPPSPGAGSPPLQSTDLTTLVPELLPLLRTVTSFIAGRPSFLEDMATVVIGLGQILAAPFPAQTRGLINTATDLLGGLGPLLQFVAQIDFARITASLRELFDADFIEGAVRMVREVSRVVTAEFVGQVVKIVGDIAPVSSLSFLFLSLLSFLSFSFLLLKLARRHC